MTTYERIREIRNKLFHKEDKDFNNELQSEISLNEILLMMGKPFAIASNGDLLNCNDNGSYKNELCDIELTLPTFDQDEETLIKILSLIE